MKESTKKSSISRRNFLKYTGMAGLAAQVVTTPIMGYKEGVSHDTYLGWESFEGETQFIDRKPYEISGVDELYRKYTPKVGPSTRPDKFTDIAWTRVGRLGGELKKNPNIFHTN